MANLKRISKTRLPARPYQLKQVRCIVQNIVEQQDCSSELVSLIVLAINEACMNIMQHAYCETKCGEIILEIFTDQDEIIFHLSDFAEPIDKDLFKPRDLNDIKPGGLGINLIYKVMDEVKFLDPPEGVGNVLQMKKKIKCNQEDKK